MALPGLLLVEPAACADSRGTLVETWRAERYAEAGIELMPAQDTVTRSNRGVLRGLHLQHPNDQAKLVMAVEGAVFDVAVDLRRGSPGFGRWDGALLSCENRRQLWIPEGLAHGFCVVGDGATVLYKLSRGHDPESELAIAWNDPDIGITWPETAPVLSDKDRNAPRLGDIDPARLPCFAAAAR